MGVPKDWLKRACTEAVAVLEERAHPRHKTSVAMRGWRAAGMEYGLPLTPARGHAELPPRTLGFIAAVVHYAIASGHESPAERALSALCAVYAKPHTGRATERTVTFAGEVMRRKSYLAGNPLVGLSLAHAFLAIDAQSVRGVLDRGAPFSDDRITAERSAAVVASAALASLREDLPTDMVRRVYTWQFKDLAPERAQKAKWLELALRPPPIGDAVAYTTDALGLFRVMAMSAALDGRVSDDEAGALFTLGQACALDRAQAKREQRRALEFYHRNQRALDPLAAAAHADSANRRTQRAPWRSLAAFMAKNGRAAVTEIKETGDLAVLIARRGAGQTLTPGETERMRAQLVDVAKAVPGLAVLTLPGGLLLLPVLARLLPFDILPSAFSSDEQTDFAVFDRKGPEPQTPVEPDREHKESA